MIPPVIVFAGKEYRPLFPDTIRELTPVERQELYDSIRNHRCVHVPVVITSDGGIVDGINRLSIAAELGLPAEAVRFDVRDYASLQEAEKVCEELNDARRQQTAEDRRRRKEMNEQRARQMRQQGMPTRAIAEQLGISQMTAARATGCSTESSDSVEQPVPSIVTGTDGRQYRILTAEQRAERNANIISMRDKGMPMHRIAANLKVGASTVAKVLADAGAAGGKARTQKLTPLQSLHAEATQALGEMKRRNQQAADAEADRDTTLAAQRQRYQAALEALYAALRPYGDLKDIAHLYRYLAKIAKKRNVALPSAEGPA